MTAIDLQLCPLKSALLLDHDNRLEVLVRVVGPPAPQTTLVRRTLNLALVIDKSGSMSGLPLDEAKRCAAAIIDRLMPGDYISVVAYDDGVEVVWPAQPVGNSQALKQVVSQICAGGCTALHDGWAAGAEQAAVNVAKAGLSRVLLLSDGCANRGLTDVGRIASHCAQIAAKGVATSTYGLGLHFNETLMLEMAKSGRGNGYYGQTAADLMGSFQQEFDLLQAIVATDLRLTLAAGEGVTLQVANDLVFDDGAWRLPDLAYASEAWALVRLKVAKTAVSAGGIAPISLLTASMRYSADGRGLAAGPVSLALESLPAAAHIALAQDDRVARRAQEVRFAEFQRDAASAARSEDWDRVDRVLEKARAEAADNEWLTASMQSLEGYARARETAKFAKEASYRYGAMRTRLSDPGEDARFDPGEERERPSFLRRLAEVGKPDRR